MTSGRTFVLIHGAWHGSWCWRDISGLLAQAGHDVVAVDLPVSDLAVGATTYAELTAALVPPDARDVVVLAHSLGCVVGPLMPGRVDVGDLILLGGPILQPGLSLADQFANGSAAVGEDLAPVSQPGVDGLIHLTPRDAVRILFHDCPPRTAAWAAGRLRPQAGTILTEKTALERWPDVRTHYLYGRQDRALPAAWVEDSVRSRLGVDPRPIDSGHSPFLACPERFVELVLESLHAP